MTPEQMLKVPYRRFLGYQRILIRRSVENRNQAARRQWEASNRGG